VKKYAEVKKISVGPYMLFASQALTVLQNELDRRENSEIVKEDDNIDE
jgi:tRNA pseudouridine-54 N-methylase